MSLYARNLRTQLVQLAPAGETVRLQSSTARTFISIIDLSEAGGNAASKVAIWIGPTVPPASVLDWPLLPDATGSRLEEGAQGPIYLKHRTGAATTLAVISSITEEPSEYIPPGQFSLRVALTTVGGDDLTTATGSPLFTLNP